MKDVAQFIKLEFDKLHPPGKAEGVFHCIVGRSFASECVRVALGVSCVAHSLSCQGVPRLATPWRPCQPASQPGEGGGGAHPRSRDVAPHGMAHRL